MIDHCTLSSWNEQINSWNDLIKREMLHGFSSSSWFVIARNKESTT